MKARWKVLIVALAVIFTMLIARPVLTFYTTKDTVTGVVTSGGIELKIHNVTSRGVTAPDEIAVIPGDKVDRKVFVENDCQQPFYLRLKLVCTIGADDEPADGLLQPNWDSENWTLVDGYYYYNGILEPGGKTPAAFTQVEVVGSRVDQSHVGLAITFEIIAQSVQSKNNTADHPWEVSGWPAE